MANTVLIEDLCFSVKTTNCLRRFGIKTAADLERLSLETLRSVPHLDDACISEILQKVAIRSDPTATPAVPRQRPVLGDDDRWGYVVTTDDEDALCSSWLSDDDNLHRRLKLAQDTHLPVLEVFDRLPRTLRYIKEEKRPVNFESVFSVIQSWAEDASKYA